MVSDVGFLWVGVQVHEHSIAMGALLTEIQEERDEIVSNSDR